MATRSEPAERGARRRERTRAQVLDAAEALLAERAVAELRVEDVSARSGVSAASIYVHFGSKDGLVSAVAQRLLALAVGVMEAAYGVEGEPLDQVREAGTVYVQLLLDHPIVGRYVLGDPAVDGSATADHVDALRAGFEGRIRAAVDAGQIGVRDPRLLSHFLLAAWAGVASLSRRHDKARLTREEIEAAVAEAIDLLALGAMASRSRSVSDKPDGGLDLSGD